MKFTLAMMRDFVATNLNEEQIGDLLTMTGFELEEIIEVNGEKVLDVNIMANRGDGASVLGMAREILAKDSSATPTELFKSAANRFPASDQGARDVWAKASATIETPNCTRFAFRIFENIENGESPDWLKDRLTKIGQRPISLLVDLTNYVMIEMGQPLHAYDLDKLPEGRIVVRNADEGETILTLDGNEHKLASDHLVICDSENPIGVAGVMGGEATECSSKTTRMLLEAAHFVNSAVRKTRKELGMFTEASYRFERHVDPDGVVAALNRFAQLYLEITGIKPIGGVADLYPKKPEIQTVKVNVNRASELLGMAVSFEEAKAILTGLGFTISGQDGENLTVVPPTWRIDILREEDLVEEIGRVHGYDKIPEALPIGSTPVGGTHGFEALCERAHYAAINSGFDQVMSHSLRDLHALDAPTGRIQVRNPHAPEIAHLRNSLLPGLAEAAVRNGGDNLHLFEWGRTHSDQGEKTFIAFLSSGLFEGQTWLPKDQSKADFYSLKGTIEDLSKALGAKCELHASSPEDERLHPGRQAQILINGINCGIIGQIHPLTAEDVNLPPHAILAEIDLDSLKGLLQLENLFHPISRNPAATRDIAILVSQSVPYVEIESAIKKSGGENLEAFNLFDVYSGKGIDPGFHSLAIALQFRKIGGNFTDEEANVLRDQIVAELAKLGAKLR